MLEKVGVFFLKQTDLGPDLRVCFGAGCWRSACERLGRSGNRDESLVLSRLPRCHKDKKQSGDNGSEPVYSELPQ